MLTNGGRMSTGVTNARNVRFIQKMNTRFGSGARMELGNFGRRTVRSRSGMTHVRNFRSIEGRNGGCWSPIIGHLTDIGGRTRNVTSSCGGLNRCITRRDRRCIRIIQICRVRGTGFHYHVMGNGAVPMTLVIHITSLRETFDRRIGG